MPELTAAQMDRSIGQWAEETNERLRAMPKTMIIPKGVGYYDCTVYPFGGDFRRAKTDRTVEVVRENIMTRGHRPQSECRLTSPTENPQQRTVYVGSDLLKDSDG